MDWSWSPDQYLLFEDARTRPVRDLLAAVPTSDVRRAVDIGCGPGTSTEALAARYPGAEVTGIDRSAEMLATARRRLPALRFEQADIAAWPDPGPYDVILANAVLQWLPDHATLLPALAARLADAGSLCVQMPDNLAEPALACIAEVARRGPWAARLQGVEGLRTPIAPPQAYHAILSAHTRRVDVWRTTYHHLLADRRAVVEWFRGSALRPYLDPLSVAERDDFLARYETALAQAVPAGPDGRVLLPYPRLFIVATR